MDFRFSFYRVEILMDCLCQRDVEGCVCQTQLTKIKCLMVGVGVQDLLLQSPLPRVEDGMDVLDGMATRENGRRSKVLTKW